MKDTRDICLWTASNVAYIKCVFHFLSTRIVCDGYLTLKEIIPFVIDLHDILFEFQVFPLNAEICSPSDLARQLQL